MGLYVYTGRCYGKLPKLWDYSSQWAIISRTLQQVTWGWCIGWAEVESFWLILLVNRSTHIYMTYIHYIYISSSATDTSPHLCEAKWVEMAPLVQHCTLRNITIIILRSNFPYIILYPHSPLCITYITNKILPLIYCMASIDMPKPISVVVVPKYLIPPYLTCC